MSDIRKNFYPHFIPMQVLTHSRLNEVIKYLDGEIRVNRAELTGTGIACGLENWWDTASNTIFIRPGYGISSDGYLLKLLCEEEQDSIAFTKFKPYVDPKLDDPNFDSPWDYLTDPNDANTAVQIPLFELLKDDATDGALINAATAGPPNFPTDYVLILYLECKEEDADDCFGDCNDQGHEFHFNLRVLAADKAEIEKLTFGKDPDNYPIVYSAANPMSIHEHSDIQRIRIKRLKNPAAMVAGGSFDTDYLWSQFIAGETVVDNHDGLSKSILQFLADKMDQAFHSDLYGVILGANANETAFTQAQINQLRTYSLPGGAAGGAEQYYYDFVKDLVDAYEEFAHEAWCLRRDCCLDDHAHPRFLFLGTPRDFVSTPAEVNDTIGCRHFFRQSASHDQAEKSRLRVRFLFGRMVEMIGKFNEPQPQQDIAIHIVPGRGSAWPLSKRSVPYYYDANDVFFKRTWSPDLGLRNRELNLLSYHYVGSGSLPAHVSQPLEYNIDEYDFFRIEGHIGRPVQSAFSELIFDASLGTFGTVKDCNLPFDVIFLKAASGLSNVGSADVSCQMEGLNFNFAIKRDEMVCRLNGIYNFINTFMFECVKVPTNKGLARFLQPDELGSIPGSASAPDVMMNDATIAGLISELNDLINNELGTDLASFSTANFESQCRKVLNLAVELYKETLSVIGYLGWARVFRHSAPAYFIYSTRIAELTHHLRSLMDLCGYVGLLKVTGARDALTSAAAVTPGFLEFVNEHSGLEHLAGVPKNGTFVMVYDSDPSAAGDNLGGDVVVADFALPYRCCNSNEKCLPINVEGADYVIGKPLIFEVDINTPLTIRLLGQPIHDVTLIPDTVATPVSSPSFGTLGTFNFPDIVYTPDPLTMPAGGGIDKFTVDLTRAGVGLIAQVDITVLIGDDKCMFIYAADHIVSTNNESPVIINVLPDAEYLFPASPPPAIVVEIDPLPLFPGTAIVVDNANGYPTIEYTPPVDFIGVVDFEYKIIDAPREAIGSVKVLVHECCGSGGVECGEVVVPDITVCIEEAEASGLLVAGKFPLDLRDYIDADVGCWFLVSFGEANSGSGQFLPGTSEGLDWPVILIDYSNMVNGGPEMVGNYMIYETQTGKSHIAQITVKYCLPPVTIEEVGKKITYCATDNDAVISIDFLAHYPSLGSNPAVGYPELYAVYEAPSTADNGVAVLSGYNLDITVFDINKPYIVHFDILQVHGPALPSARVATFPFTSNKVVTPGGGTNTADVPPVPPVPPAPAPGPDPDPEPILTSYSFIHGMICIDPCPAGSSHGQLIGETILTAVTPGAQFWLNAITGEGPVSFVAATMFYTLTSSNAAFDSTPKGFVIVPPWTVGGKIGGAVPDLTITPGMLEVLSENEKYFREEKTIDKSLPVIISEAETLEGGEKLQGRLNDLAVASQEFTANIFSFNEKLEALYGAETLANLSGGKVKDAQDRTNSLADRVKELETTDAAMTSMLRSAKSFAAKYGSTENIDAELKRYNAELKRMRSLVMKMSEVTAQLLTKYSGN